MPIYFRGGVEWGRWVEPGGRSIMLFYSVAGLDPLAHGAQVGVAHGAMAGGADDHRGVGVLRAAVPVRSAAVAAGLRLGGAGQEPEVRGDRAGLLADVEILLGVADLAGGAVHVVLDPAGPLGEDPDGLRVGPVIGGWQHQAVVQRLDRRGGRALADARLVGDPGRGDVDL